MTKVSKNSSFSPLYPGQATEGEISSWVGDDQRMLHVVYFCRQFFSPFFLLSFSLSALSAAMLHGSVESFQEDIL